MVVAAGFGHDGFKLGGHGGELELFQAVADLVKHGYLSAFW
jgi:hypothetical protein